jgi:hypothetical protein
MVGKEVAEALEAIADGFARLAKATRVADERGERPGDEWIHVAESPLGRRKTLALARAGALESTKIGKRVLVRRASLEALLERGRRGGDEGEDLFGVAS